MSEPKLTLEHELKVLLTKYSIEDITFFEKVFKESDTFLTEMSIECNTIAKEDGSNGY